MLTRSAARAGVEERERVALESANGLENIAKSFINTKENGFLSHQCACVCMRVHAMCYAMKLIRNNITFNHEENKTKRTTANE